MGKLEVGSMSLAIDMASLKLSVVWVPCVWIPVVHGSGRVWVTRPHIVTVDLAVTFLQ